MPKTKLKNKENNPKLQVIGNKHIKHLPKRSTGFKRQYSESERLLLDIVQKKKWYPDTISKGNASNIKINLQNGVISGDRVKDTLEKLGYKNEGTDKWVKK
jgi:hypothetical protein